MLFRSGGVSLNLVGSIPLDPNVRQAVIRQRPFCDLFPDSDACRAVDAVARKLSRWKPQEHLDGNIKFFWKKLLFAE